MPKLTQLGVGGHKIFHFWSPSPTNLVKIGPGVSDKMLKDNARQPLAIGYLRDLGYVKITMSEVYFWKMGKNSMFWHWECYQLSVMQTNSITVSLDISIFYL